MQAANACANYSELESSQIRYFGDEFELYEGETNGQVHNVYVSEIILFTVMYFSEFFNVGVTFILPGIIQSSRSQIVAKFRDHAETSIPTPITAGNRWSAHEE